MTLTNVPDRLTKAAAQLLDPGEALEGVVPAIQFKSSGSSMHSGGGAQGASNAIKYAVIATSKRYLIHGFSFWPIGGYRIWKHGTDAPRSTQIYLQSCDRSGGDKWFMTEAFGTGTSAFYIRREFGDLVERLNSTRPEQEPASTA